MYPFEFIGPAIIIGTLLLGIGFIIRTILNYFLRKKILDKGDLNESTLKAMKLEENRHTALKWGMVVLFGGIGLILLEFIPYEVNSSLPYGLEAVMISAGFLVYYFMVKRESAA
jgi:membrane-anchored glycerophosphoryl diester phosphodiesterase (GDPDase)